MAARLSAEMRLGLDSLRQDAERAASIMQQTMSRRFGGGGMGGLSVDPTATIRDIFAMSPTGKNINKGMFGMGIGAGMFSPWIGARLISQSGMLGKMAGIGGGNGITASLFGQGGFGAFGAAYLGLQLATRALKGAFDDLRRSVRDAAQLFFDAAKLRVSPGQLMATKTTLRALGVPESQELLESLSYGRGRMSSGNMTKMIGISGQQGAANYMQGYLTKDKRFWDDMASNSRDFHVLWTMFSYQLQRTSSTIANDLLPSLNQFFVVINKIANVIPAATGAIAKIVGIAAGASGSQYLLQALTGSNGKNVFGDKAGIGDMPSMPWNRLHQSSFERMGFVIGNMNNPVEYQRQIAANTRDIANYIKAFLPAVQGRAGAAAAAPNLP